MNTLMKLGPRRRMMGVTLLELMIVVLVIGLLGMIAIPSYRQYTVRAHRTEAKSALLQVQANQERFYLANRRYGSVADLVGANLMPANALSENGSYVITMPVADVITFTATASPASGATFDMTQDTGCASFSIDNQGVRTATGTDAARCW
jgi:type IV pilus assembly protein PilE